LVSASLVRIQAPQPKIIYFFIIIIFKNNILLFRNYNSKIKRIHLDGNSSKINNNNIEDKWSITVRFAGDSGDGMQLTGGRLTFEAAISGMGLATFPDYPAEIRAPAGTTFGVSSFQVRFGKGLIASSGDHANILVAMNPAALKVNIKEVIPGGLIILDSSSFNDRGIKKAGYMENPLENNSLSGLQLISADISNLTIKAIKEFRLGNKDGLRCRNMWTLGLILWLFNKDTKETITWLKNKFGKDNFLTKANVAALNAGHKYAENTEISSDIIRKVVPKVKPVEGKWKAITGAESLAFGLAVGALKANLKMTLCSYPITPASPIMHYLANYELKGIGIYQAEDEIAACCSAIGVSYAGGLGVTSSSGPGISLKTEAIGLAVSVELPLIIINSQRAGPSTGLPTRAEQSDLMQAIYGRHGEAPLVVFAPKSPSHCFEIAQKAINIAIKYMTPVMILSDAYLTNASEPWLIPDISKIKESPAIFESYQQNYMPFERNPDTLARKWVKPGTKGMEHRIGGLEKDSLSGNISYDPENHEEMTKLRAKKIKLIQREINNINIVGPDKGDILIIGWGSTNGPISEAQELLANQGFSIAHVQISCLWPISDNLKDIAAKYKSVTIVEMNDGQLYNLLKVEMIPKAQSITQVSGKPFRVSFLSEEFKKIIKSGK
jgi:2-oxoglutarate/2-oxoacid ferredoxin oxidoreductase subunit alpha